MDVNLLGLERGKSVFILNEGAFSQGNASVCLAPDGENLECGIYQKQVDMPLGDVLNSGLLTDDAIYFIVNGSGRVVKCDLSDLSVESSQDLISSPRNLLLINESKAYLSELYGNKVAVLDPHTLDVLNEIEFPGWSEEMVYQASYVWVTNPELYGGPITDHVYIIDPASDRIVDSVKFSRNPTAIESDMEGNLWVLCAGSPIDGDSARLFKYDPDTRDVLDFWSLPASFTAKLAISAATGEVAFVLDKLYMLEAGGTVISEMAQLNELVSAPYGLEFDPTGTSLWITDAVDFSSQGKVYKWNMVQMTLDAEFNAGINPNGVLFY